MELYREFIGQHYSEMNLSTDELRYVPEKPVLKELGRFSAVSIYCLHAGENYNPAPVCFLGEYVVVRDFEFLKLYDGNTLSYLNRLSLKKLEGEGGESIRSGLNVCVSGGRIYASNAEGTLVFDEDSLQEVGYLELKHVTKVFHFGKNSYFLGGKYTGLYRSDSNGTNFELVAHTDYCPSPERGRILADFYPHCPDVHQGHIVFSSNYETFVLNPDSAKVVKIADGRVVGKNEKDQYYLACRLGDDARVQTTKLIASGGRHEKITSRRISLSAILFSNGIDGFVAVGKGCKKNYSFVSMVDDKDDKQVMHGWDEGHITACREGELIITSRDTSTVVFTSDGVKIERFKRRNNGEGVPIVYSARNKLLVGYDRKCNRMDYVLYELI